MKTVLIVMAFFTSLSVSAQFSINGGVNSLKAFGVPGLYGGLHLGLEIPREDGISIYGRFSHYFSKDAQDSIFTTGTAINPATTFPTVVTGRGTASMNYTIIEGGTRYYLGDGFDYGWAAYGGTTLKLIFNGVRTNFETIDQSLYTVDGGGDGTILNFGVGLNGGVKYTRAPLGTFYADLGLSYILFSAASTTNINASLYSPIFFDFSIGYRRDLGW